MDITKLKLKKLNRNGLDRLIEWAREEGWNPGPYDASVFWQCDPEAYYGYYFQGKLIAGGSIVSYDGLFGFMGFFIVHPDYRGKGIGRRLWKERKEKLLSRLRPDASIGMDGVVDMQDFYQKGGFRIAFRDERYMCIGKAFDIDENISQISSGDYQEILQYDLSCFGYPRPQFLISWLQMPESKSFKYTKNGVLKGFVHLRKAHTGYKAGPLFADDAITAEALYQACLNAARGKEVYLDIPLCNKEACSLVKKYKASYVFECARMYCGPPPDYDTSKIFGISSFELG
jgi:GNAT superfamily N-acetyltransferase